MGMQGIGVGMMGIRESGWEWWDQGGNAGNKGGNAGNCVGNAGNWGWEWGELGCESTYRSGIDELELWRGIKIKGNKRIYRNSFDTLGWETNKETNLNTDFCFHNYYFIWINRKENMLNINVFLVIV